MREDWYGEDKSCGNSIAGYADLAWHRSPSPALPARGREPNQFWYWVRVSITSFYL